MLVYILYIYTRHGYFSIDLLLVNGTANAFIHLERNVWQYVYVMYILYTGRWSKNRFSEKVKRKYRIAFCIKSSYRKVPVIYVSFPFVNHWSLSRFPYTRFRHARGCVCVCLCVIYQRGYTCLFSMPVRMHHIPRLAFRLWFVREVSQLSYCQIT